MELREIEYLLTIYETGSIRGAAERLMIAQPSLSQFLSQYESELGTKRRPARSSLRTRGRSATSTTAPWSRCTTSRK